MTASFELAGREFVALNGGSSFTFSQGFSHDWDRLSWDRLSEDGEPGPCDWLSDRFGVSWQIAPGVVSGLAFQQRVPVSCR
jgi:predicted 3-demethylubiquinone-9 3-methyltransferase (glyoxalase superfamily)